MSAQKIGRREFLKVTGAALGAMALPGPRWRPSASPESPHIIILVLDALSALHLSLHGYGRRTTPNLDALAQHATVFHAHYSAGNYTTTGTAAMFTGTLPWRNRALNPGALIGAQLARQNPFQILAGEGYQTLGFSQNIWAHRLMLQCGGFERLLVPSSFSLLDARPVVAAGEADALMRSFAIDEFLMPLQAEDAPGASLLAYLRKRRTTAAAPPAAPRYPKGYPAVNNPGYWIPYLNESVFPGVLAELDIASRSGAPLLAYVHLWSPHSPYRPRADHRDLFRSDFAPRAKPTLHFPKGQTEAYLLSQRTQYDRQVAQVDDELGRLVAGLEETGILDESYLIVTSDHGELFERGFVGHGFERLYEGVLRVPLIVRAPAQRTRMDVFEPTSHVDLLATLLHLAGSSAGIEGDGSVLPGLGGLQGGERPIYALYAATNSSFEAIRKCSIAMRRGEMKLIAYLGFPGLDNVFELYDLDSDPEELKDLASRSHPRFGRLKDELLTTLEEANRKYASASSPRSTTC